MTAAPTALRRAGRDAIVLLLFSVAFTSLLAASHGLTAERIRHVEQAAKEAQLAQVLPAGGFDQSLLPQRRPLAAGLLGNRQPAFYYRALRAGQVQAVVLEATATGYGGPIQLLVGIGRDGRILGIRVPMHKETPGLGDYIDPARSDWNRQLLGQGAAAHWRVRKDGGDFDARAGATISPRAVLATVQDSLRWASSQPQLWQENER